MDKTKQINKINKPSVTFALVALNTFLRPEMLQKCLLAINNLVVPQNIKVEVLVVDNDENASAKKITEDITQQYNFKLHYCVEEKRGLSNARNRILKEAVNLNASHIAICDDDDMPDSEWLIKHIELYNKLDDAMIISGPEYTAFDGDFPKYITNNNIFIHSTTKKTGEKRATCSTHNAFFPVNIMTESNIWFDPCYIFMGGEDGDFFKRAQNAGFNIVFNREAIVREITDKNRANIKWILSRSYYNGYSGSFLKFKNKNKPFAKLLYMIKLTIIIPIDIIILPFTLLLGLTAFFNMLGLIYKNFGKFVGAISKKPIKYYECLNGGISV